MADRLRGQILIHSASICFILNSMKIALDTNIFFHGRDHIVWRSLQSLDEYCRSSNIEMLIPRIVLLEVENKHRIAVGNYNLDVAKINKQSRISLTGGQEEIQPLDVDAEMHLLRERLIGASGMRIRVIENDNDSEKAVERVFLGKKPAKRAGIETEKGIRDTLIWLSITKEFMSSFEKMCFLSDNSKDFGGDGPGGFHQDLWENVYRKTEEHRLTYYKSIAEFRASDVTEFEVKILLLTEEITDLSVQLGAVIEDERFLDGYIRYKTLDSFRSDTKVDIATVMGEVDQRRQSLGENRKALYDRIQELSKDVAGLKIKLEERSAQQ